MQDITPKEYVDQMRDVIRKSSYREDINGRNRDLFHLAIKITCCNNSHLRVVSDMMGITRWWIPSKVYWWWMAHFLDGDTFADADLFWQLVMKDYERRRDE